MDGNDRSKPGGKEKEEEHPDKIRTADKKQAELYGDVAGERDSGPTPPNPDPPTPPEPDPPTPPDPDPPLPPEPDPPTPPNPDPPTPPDPDPDPDPIPETDPTPAELTNKERRKIARRRAFEREFDIVRNTGSRNKKEAAYKIARSASGKMAGTAIKAAGATTGALFGLATGIATGDPSAAFKNASLGASAGGAIGSGLSNRGGKLVDNVSTGLTSGIEQAKKDYWGNDYDSKQNEKLDNEFVKNKEMRSLYQQKLNLRTKQEIDDAMNQAKEYRKYGVTDNDLIIKAMKADNGNDQNRASKTRIAAARLASGSKSEKDLENSMKRFAKTPGMSESKVKNMERLVRNINDL